MSEAKPKKCSRCGGEATSNFKVAGFTKPYCNPCFLKIKKNISELEAERAKNLAQATVPDSISMLNPDADGAGWSHSEQRNWIEVARLAAAAEEVL